MHEKHFFSDVASISWISWAKRRFLWAGTNEPKILYDSPLETKPLSLSACGTFPVKVTAEKAKEYCEFLKKYFYGSEYDIVLDIPPQTLANSLSTGDVIGVEIRDKDRVLIGCIFDIYAGNFEGESIGLVTWMCVAPTWRKKGIGSSLLYALYYYCKPRRIHWWRNDGWLKSPLPPVYTENKIIRQRIKTENNLQSLELVSLARWKKRITEVWKKQNPSGLVLDDILRVSPWLECYELKNKVVLVVQPTFEVKKQKKSICEVIAWIFLDSSDENSVYLEEAINMLPYKYIEAPNTMPHTCEKWLNAGLTSWSCIGFDPGVIPRPLLPLFAA
jgi:GNAT superfamily N-acetyltransferase